jgi:hypothetical protein
LRTAFRGAVQTVTNLAGNMAANATEQEFGLWRADPDDLNDIATPAARLVWRRLPEDAKGSDAVDIFALGLALVAYMGKNLQLRSGIRRAIATGQVIPSPADQAAATPADTAP